jgi:hypothetical protein
MAVVDIGTATSEQLQSLVQHSAMQGAFSVFVCRKAALSASLAAAGAAEAAAAVQLEKAAAQLQELSLSGITQVSWLPLVAVLLGEQASHGTC